MQGAHAFPSRSTLAQPQFAGFNFRQSGPLDLRMDQRRHLSLIFIPEERRYRLRGSTALLVVGCGCLIELRLRCLMDSALFQHRYHLSLSSHSQIRHCIPYIVVFAPYMAVLKLELNVPLQPVHPACRSCAVLQALIDPPHILS